LISLSLVSIAINRFSGPPNLKYCSLINAIDNIYCSKCSYSLLPSAFDEIKEAENQRIQAMEKKYEGNLKAMREDMENEFQQILTKIDMNKL
jgi:integrase/recombinase XerD